MDYQYLTTEGVDALWSKIKNWANTRFATGVQNASVDGGVKVDILNGADTTATLASTTIANATTTTNGAMSATDKSKLDGIAAKAEVNQNAFGKVVVGSTTVAADAKVDTLTLAGSNVTLTPDATNDKVTIGITKANVTAALGYTPPTKDTTYTLPTASADTLGGVKVGTNLSIADGVLSSNDKKVDVSVNYAKVICFTGMAKSEVSTGTAEYNTDLLLNDAVLARGAEVWIGEKYDNRMYVTESSVAFQTKGSDGTYSTTSSINATQYTGNAATATTATSASKVANALTLKLNGTSQGAYDGSAAKEIDITASSVGAAATSHNHAASNITSGTIAAARLPLATTSTAGAIKVGDGLSISNGVLSATAGSTSKVNDLIGQSCVDFRTLNSYSATYSIIVTMHDYGVATIETAAASARAYTYARVSADTTTLPAGRYKLVLVCDDTSVEDLICYSGTLAKDYIHVAMTVVDSTGANNNPDTWLAFALVNGVTPTTSVETTRTVTDTFTLDADTTITAYIWLPITTTAIPRYRLGFAIERLLPEVKPTSVTVNINYGADGYYLDSLENCGVTNDNSYSFTLDLSGHAGATWRELLADGVLGADTPGYPQLLNYYNTTYVDDIRESTYFETAGYPDSTDNTVLQSTQTMALTTTGYSTRSNGVAVIRLTSEPTAMVSGDEATQYYAPFSVDDAVDGYGTDTLYFALALYA